MNKHTDRFILKFADDTVIVILLTKDENCDAVVSDFMTLCDSAFLQVNVKKTRDMVIDIRSSSLPPHQPEKGQMVEWVSSYKYLVFIIGNKCC